MKKKINFKWNVWLWNFNQDKLEVYDVVPTFIGELKSLKKNEKPKTKEEFEEFLSSTARYWYWSKCEYEMVIHSWPSIRKEEKVDIYQQLMLNWDVFVDYFWKNYCEIKNEK